MDSLAGVRETEEREAYTRLTTRLPRGLVELIYSISLDQEASTGEVVEELLLDSLARRAGVFAR